MMITIDGIEITYDKEKHIRNHFDLGQQFRSWLMGKYNRSFNFSLMNEGEEKGYSYLASISGKQWRIITRQVWVDTKVFRNVLDEVHPLDPPTNKRIYS